VAIEQIENWLGSFGLDRGVHDHLAVVFQNLPDEVRSDLMDDPSFQVCDYAPHPHAVLNVPVRLAVPGQPGRSVVLKRTINHRPASFARWVIAHELAHAYLRHGGRWPREDPEQAADGLAAQWGFPKP
jgi:hypothetical protein